MIAHRPATGHNGRVMQELIARWAAMLEPLQAQGDQRQYFHATYSAHHDRGGRGTPARRLHRMPGGSSVGTSRSPTCTWMRWRLARRRVAGPPLGHRVQRTRRPAPLRHVLPWHERPTFNYDLPQALLAVITDEQFR